MAEGKKKPIMIAVIVVCLILAGIITYFNSKGEDTGAESVAAGVMMWVKCENPDCNADYEMDQKEFYTLIEQMRDPGSGRTPSLVCQSCGEESIREAAKCPKCDLVFVKRSLKQGDYADRCPDCGYSEREDAQRTGD